MARLGECANNRPETLSRCPESCHSIAGISVDALSKSEALEDAARGFVHFLHRGDEVVDDDGEGGTAICEDDSPECAEMALEGACVDNPTEMLTRCRRSCLACFGGEPATVTIDFGVEQLIDPPDGDLEIRDKILDVINRTGHYMADEIFYRDDYLAVRRDCRNLDPRCSEYAAMDECHGDVDALIMFQNCAPACRACEAVEHYRRCARRPEQVDVFMPGDMNGMFERIVRDHERYRPTILSRPESAEEEKDDDADDYDENPLPWIITLENFVTAEECDWLIAKGHEIGFEQTAEISEELEEEGTYGDKVGGGRTSTDAWCQEGCEDQPMGSLILNRMTEMVGIPMENTENLEILKYEEGGHYEEHHDLIPTHVGERCGGRMLTFYVFLNDVEEGGELRFTDLDIEIKAKRGRAVIWPSVLDKDLNIRQDLTFHEAMPVKRGKKYGANLWFHPLNTREAMEDECCE